MKTACRLAVFALSSSILFAQPNFDDVSSPGGVAAQPAVLAQPVPQTDGQTGQGSHPSSGYNDYEYGNWNNGYYNSYNNIRYRYDSIRRSIQDMRRYYPRGSYARHLYDAHLDYGARLYSQYRRWQDPNSLWALQAWISQWEGYVQSYGYYGWGNGGYSGGWGTTYDRNRGGYDHGSGNGSGYGYDDSWRYRDYGYYDTYPRMYYGPYYSDTFAHAYGVGDGIGHIVSGSRNRNDLELWGGILGTAGNVLNVVNDSRYNRRY
jgi:hypothetical protein